METLHYSFCDYLKAFEQYDLLYAIHGDNVALVISENFYTSGYWIEAADKDLTPGDTRYNHAEAMELRRRVIHEIQHASYHMRPPRFIK